MTLKSINPFTLKIIEEFKPFSTKEINNKINQSEIAFSDWRKTSFDARGKLMLKVAKLLIENSEDLGRTITEEMGKPLKEAIAEVEKCAWVCKYYASEAKIFLHREAVAADSHLAYIQYEPLGAILGIMPWNYPFWQVFRFAVPTIMAGNVVLIKHASNVQRCARAIQDIFIKAGFPSGVYQNLVLEAGRVKKIIENPAIKAVSLTGSESAGASVASAAGAKIKKSVLELGGNNSFIVLDDADIDKAVEIGIKARMQNGGQSCIAAKRFILHKKISGEFIKKFTAKVNKLVAGDPLDEKTDIGPLASVEQAEKVQEQLEKSVEMGARILAGSEREGALFYPTVVADVKPGMPLFDEEVFGPVAPVIIVKDEEEAIKISNNSVFGLGVSLFTNDLDKAEKLSYKFDDGAVFINALVKSDPRLPFGGTKHSGYGRELSIAGIREFVNVKTVYMEKFHEYKGDNEKTASISIGSPT